MDSFFESVAKQKEWENRRAKRSRKEPCVVRFCVSCGCHHRRLSCSSSFARSSPLSSAGRPGRLLGRAQHSARPTERHPSGRSPSNAATGRAAATDEWRRLTVVLRSDPRRASAGANGAPPTALGTGASLLEQRQGGVDRRALATEFRWLRSSLRWRSCVVHRRSFARSALSACSPLSHAQVRTSRVREERDDTSKLGNDATAGLTRTLHYRCVPR